MKLLALFSFVLIATIVVSQNTYTGCMDQMQEQVKTDFNNSCQHIEDFVTCILRVSDVANRPDVEESFELNESSFRSLMTQLGLTCDIDFNELIDKVKKENAGSTTSPIGWLVAMVTSFLVAFKLQL